MRRSSRRRQRGGRAQTVFAQLTLKIPRYESIPTLLDQMKDRQGIGKVKTRLSREQESIATIPRKHKSDRIIVGKCGQPFIN